MYIAIVRHCCNKLTKTLCVSLKHLYSPFEPIRLSNWEKYWFRIDSWLINVNKLCQSGHTRKWSETQMQSEITGLYFTQLHQTVWVLRTFIMPLHSDASKPFLLHKSHCRDYPSHNLMHVREVWNVPRPRNMRVFK